MQLATTKRWLAEANEHIKTLKDDNDMLARIVNVLAIENTQFRDQLETASTAVVRPIQ